jgi:low affinity Fe/Cu permease
MPSAVDGHVSLFDRFAAAASRFVARATFFAMCLLLVVLWAPSILVVGSIDTWQLIINTITTIVTFLLVALLQNTQSRADQAVQQKLNAIAAALSELMAGEGGMAAEVRELRAAVGLEDREES